MIVAMKKVYVVLLADKREEAVADLKQLGLVHVSEKQVQSAKIEALKNQQAMYRKAQVVLSQVMAKKLPKAGAVSLSAEALVERILSLGSEIKTLEEAIEKSVKEEMRLMPWGSFDPATVTTIIDHGYHFQLYIVAKADVAKIAQETPYIYCCSTKTKSLIAVLKSDVVLPSSAELFELPTVSLAEREKLTLSQRQKLKHLKEELGEFLPAYNSLEKSAFDIEKELEVACVEASVESDGAVAILEGFVPFDLTKSVQDWAREKAWGLAITDPTDDDRVPTLLKSPKPVRMLRPILSFLGTTPGYQERDISHYFLFFLTIFFAMIIGDAIYGCILLAIGVLVGIKIKLAGKKLPDFIPLIITFSLATITWGAMTGTWLGLASLAEIPFLKQFQVPFLTGAIDARVMFNPELANHWPADLAPQIAQKNLMLLCFTMGLGHLVLAHILRFFRELFRKPHIQAFAQLGWASVIFGAFWLVLNLVLDSTAYPVPAWAMYFIGGGMGAVFLFEQQQGDNFFKGVLRALANFITTALSGVSAFADVISYIRLFAVGLAGFAIEGSFNAMAQGAFDGGGAAVIGGVLIMFFGHTLNLVMGALSVIVHGVRLNMLEYSSHIGLEWTGFNYKPFGKEA